VSISIDDGTDSASADFTIYLVLREAGWKVWGANSGAFGRRRHERKSGGVSAPVDASGRGVIVLCAETITREPLRTSSPATRPMSHADSRGRSEQGRLGGAPCRLRTRSPSRPGRDAMSG
jgi:hypothetical protein